MYRPMEQQDRDDRDVHCAVPFFGTNWAISRQSGHFCSSVFFLEEKKHHVINTLPKKKHKTVLVCWS